MISTLQCWVKVSTDDNLKYYSEKIGFEISCKLSPKETVCINCQRLFRRHFAWNVKPLFSGRKRTKNIVCHLLNLPRESERLVVKVSECLWYILTERKYCVCFLERELKKEVSQFHGNDKTCRQNAESCFSIFKRLKFAKLCH